MSETFGQFGKHFQEQLVWALLTDKIWAEQIIEVIDSSYFDLKYLAFLSDKYFEYSKKYKDFPTLHLLVSIIKNDLKTTSDLVLRDQIIDYLQRIKLNNNPCDIPFVKEKALEFCRKQALKEALNKSVELMSTEKYESIVEVIKKAVTVGTSTSNGHDLTEDIEARFVASKRYCIPIGIPELDKEGILNGGVGGGELLSIIASTGAGKSHMLVNIGASALKLKKNVLHYTFELSDINVGTRYDSNLCEIDSDQVFSNKEKVLDFYKENKNNLGRLKIKEFPMNSATVLTLKAHIDKLKISGFFPDIILIDYADIMRSTRQFDSLRLELKLIYEELRGLAQELKIPICTASQSNKEGTNADVIDETNMSEGFGKAFVADIIVTISRKPLEKSTGKGRIFLAKNRAGKDGLLYPVNIDTAQSRFSICGSQITQSEATESDEKEMKKVLKKKWEELQKDKSVKLVDSKSSEEIQTIIQPQLVESDSSQQSNTVS